MCAIIGALTFNLTTPERHSQANALLNFMTRASHERGRDGRGFVCKIVTADKSYRKAHRDTDRSDSWVDTTFFPKGTIVGCMVGNLRAEPTTEYVAEKLEHDQQPYHLGDWSIAHNGTIANDKELRTHKHPTSIDSAAIRSEE